MENKRQGLGYVFTDVTCDDIIFRKGDTFRAQKLHWSKSQDVPSTLTSYSYVHFSSNPKLAKNFLSAMSKSTRSKVVSAL